MKELINLRKPREKHFLNEDGTITLNMYDEDIHYKKGDEYIEIDNNLIESNDKVINKENDFKVEFSKDKFLVSIKENNKFINITLNDEHHLNDIIYQDNSIIYKNILSNIDIKYDIVGKTAKETIIVNDRINNFSNIKFNISTNLQLIEKDNNILAIDENENIVYKFVPPYMIDDKQEFFNCSYLLEKLDNEYLLTLVLDEEWLNNASYPILIDPTIAAGFSGVYDTYIYPGDANVNRNSHEYLKLGVDSNNVKYRILTKFDLPKLSTSCSVISAVANFVSHPDDLDDGLIPTDYIGLYALTKDWNESNANWDNMNDAFEDFCYDYTVFKRTKFVEETNTKTLITSSIDITNLVKEWYKSKPNYGFMLKYFKEEYDPYIQVHKVYSKNNTAVNKLGVDPKPYLSITYRSRNGEYPDMTYVATELSLGTSYLNVLNGNIINLFAITRTTRSDLNVGLNIYYNSNDVIQNESNICFAKGWRFNYDQYLKKITIRGAEYLEYITGSGNENYFIKNNEGEYISEDGNQIEVYESGNEIVLYIDDNKFRFIEYETSNYILTDIEDFNSNKLLIFRNLNNTISKIIDSNNKTVEFEYSESNIIIHSDYLDVNLVLDNNLLKKIESKYSNVEFEYNDNNLISRIIDSDNQKLVFDYYDSLPYKAKKIAKYSENDNVGSGFDISYEFNTTTIKNSSGISTCYAFNKYDNLVEVTNNAGSTKYDSYYGYNNSYQMIETKYTDDEFTHSKIEKLSKSSIALKPIVNLLPNKYMYNVFGSNPKIEKVLYDNIDKRYLRIKESIDQKLSVTIDKSGYYTLSFDAKTEENGYAIIKLFGSNNNSVSKQITIPTCVAFERYSITNYFDVSEKITLSISNYGYIDMDNFQLEYCAAANPFNLIENSCFTYLDSAWEFLTKSHISTTSSNPVHYAIEGLKDGARVCHIKSDPYHHTMINQIINVYGNKGDNFNLSFLYKNLGLHEALDEDYEYILPGAKVTLRFLPAIPDVEETFETYFLNNHSEWGMFNQNFIAPYEFNAIVLEVDFDAEINDFYVSYFSLFKQPSDFEIKYDERGNLTEFIDANNSKTELTYTKENEIAKVINNGKQTLSYEYSKKDATQILNVLSSNGVKQNIGYDKDGHIISSKSRNVGTINNVLSNINIRAKGTNKYVTLDYNTKGLVLKENLCNISSFDIVDFSNGKKVVLSQLKDNALCEQKDLVIVTNYIEAVTLNLINNDDKSYRLVNSKNNKYLYIDNDVLKFKDFVEGDEGFDFFFEGNDYNEFLGVSYSKDNTTLKRMDSLGKSVQYEVDEVTNLLKEMIDPKGIKTIYRYNEIDQLIEIEKEGKIVYYVYNDSKKLQKIISGSKTYAFNYDEFLNIKEVLLNDRVLISYEYDNVKNNITKQKFCNGDLFNYYYSSENNLIKMTVEKDAAILHTIEYYYDNFNRLVKIKCDDRECSISYDILRRINMYNIDDIFNTVHKYNEDELITEINYNYDDNKMNIKYEYDDTDTLVKTTVDLFDSLNYFTYDFDYLGRIKNKYINDNHLSSVEYYSNGDRTSSLIKKEQILGKQYLFTYDANENLENVYFGDKLEKHYEYDNLERLIKEIDYTNNISYVYSYDLEGNILSVRNIDIITGEVLHVDDYQYSTSQDDLLLSFNGTNIEYDSLGNPIKIGSANLTWEYGKKISSYKDANNEITYKYDYNGNLIEKVCNGTKIKYYYDGGRLICEDNRGRKLFYFYDENNDLLGFTFMTSTFYYEKNKNDDIIGILDSDLNRLVTYEYDSWGNILSMKDASGNEITSKFHIGVYNPFRYRSYFYDDDIKMYYLKTRMYNPLWRRFINADGIINAEQSIDGYNFYAYVGNNPVNNFDVDGCFSLLNSAKKTIDKVVKETKKIIKKAVSILSKTENKKSSAKMLSNNTSCEKPKMSLKDTKTQKYDFFGREIKVESSVSINSRGQALIDGTIEIDTNGGVSSVIDIGNASISSGPTGIGANVKTPAIRGHYFILQYNFHPGSDWRNGLGESEFGIGYGYNAEYASAENIHSYKVNNYYLVAELILGAYGKVRSAIPSKETVIKGIRTLLPST